MNVFDWEEIFSHPRLANVSKTFRKTFLDRMVETSHAKATRSEETSPKVMLEMKGKPFVPTTPRPHRPKPSATKKKQKKLQQVLVLQSLRKYPQEIRQKGKMDKSQKPHEPLVLDEEELHGGIEEMKDKEGAHMTWLPKYIPPRKGKAKVSKDLDSAKFMVPTPLLQKRVVFEGSLLGCIPSLKLEDWDLEDHEKFPQLATNKYLVKIDYK